MKFADIGRGVIDGLVTWAGLPGVTGVAGSLLVSVNYFGSIALLQGLRPLLAKGDRAGAKALWNKLLASAPDYPGRAKVQEKLAR